MKKLVFLLVTMAGASFATAQKISEKEVPMLVKSALKKKYSNVKEVKWEKENHNYEAGFEIAKTNYSVLIAISGQIIETEVEIGIDALPKNAKTYLKEKYPGEKIREAAKITKANGEIIYEAEIKDGDVLFDSTGKFIELKK